MFPEDSRAVHPRLGWRAVITIQCVTALLQLPSPLHTQTHTHPHVYTDISPLTIFFAFLASFFAFLPSPAVNKISADHRVPEMYY